MAEEGFFFSPGNDYEICKKTGPFQGCQIFLGTTYQNGKNIPKNHKIYQMATEYIKWPQNIPNGHKIYQQHLLMQVPPPNLPKFGFLV
jgi:hypothetical protein